MSCTNQEDAADQTASEKKEIYTYSAPWTVFSMAWSQRLDTSSRLRLAIGSYSQKYINCVQIVTKSATTSSSSSSSCTRDDNSYSLCKICEFDHPYPCTKIMWSPDSTQGSRDLVATSADYLRLWNLTENRGAEGALKARMETVLRNKGRGKPYSQSLASFDWNKVDPNIIGTASIDTTCTIWDVSRQSPLVHFVAHDREVFDIAFAQGKDIFASVGADGSMRMFDLRQLTHSTIIYESPGYSALLRLEWNKQDPNYLATFAADSGRTLIMDVRVPSTPILELGGHAACLNAVAWAPHSHCHICTAGDDNQALIWDLSQENANEAVLAYGAEGEINNLQWSALQPNWVSIAYRDKIQILRV